MTVRILQGDCRELLRTLQPDSVHCCITSPPYFGLRDYDVDGQYGLEATPEEFIDVMVSTFREVRRVLRHDGTLWLNIGDSYASSGRGGNPTKESSTLDGTLCNQDASIISRTRGPFKGHKHKDLMGIPWMLAFALRADGWYLRQDIIWSKPNPMPESVRDRCTKSHEYLFLLTKSARYYYDADAIRTRFSEETKSQSFDTMEFKKRDKYKKPAGWDTGKGGHGSIHRHGREKGAPEPEGYIPKNGANKRSVWTVPTQAFSEAHFATVQNEQQETVTP